MSQSKIAYLFIKAVPALFTLLAMGNAFVATGTLAQEMRDPTRPANKEPVLANNPEGGEITGAEGLGDNTENQQGSFPKVKLSAIVVTEDRKYAIIDNVVVYEGQQWKNVFLSKIKSYSVTFKLNDQTKEITINNNDFITESDDQF